MDYQKKTLEIGNKHKGLVKMMRRIKYRIFILYMAFFWMFQINLGDKVLYRGRKYLCINSDSQNSYKLAPVLSASRASSLSVRALRSECAKIKSPANIFHGFKSGIRFYSNNWLDIWVRNGVEPWVWGLNIFPDKAFVNSFWCGCLIRFFK